MFGPQDDHFTDAALAALTATDWTVMPRSDRMGCRLDGAVLPHARGFNIVSDGVVPGSVQVPGDGRPIVLMRDCQTTGGYPKIATVIGPDLDRLAQVPPGGTVRFAAVARTEAVAAAAALRQRIDGLAALARPAGADPSSEDLLALNLIGGVVDATAVG
jgi:allophanate hydrolase subunit 2